jgi:thiol-disulfide isomerase/thioredoxin
VRGLTRNRQHSRVALTAAIFLVYVAAAPSNCHSEVSKTPHKSPPKEASPAHQNQQKRDSKKGQPQAQTQRLFMIKPKGYVHVGQYSAPGYYTLILFSAPWCVPCNKLREHAPEWLAAFPNLVIVDLDIGTNNGNNGVDEEGSAILADLDYNSALPAALLLNPFGLYVNKQDQTGIARAICGYDEILSRIESALRKRKHLEVIPMGAGNSLASLARLESRSRRNSTEKKRDSKATADDSISSQKTQPN